MAVRVSPPATLNVGEWFSTVFPFVRLLSMEARIAGVTPRG